MGNNFIENRKNGENDSYICHLIRNDLIDEFIAYVKKKNNISLKATINPSIFETNSFLIGKTPTLIEYSAFFGSIQIFTYLFMNKVELNQYVCLYAIHGASTEIFSIIEDNYYDLSNSISVSTKVMQEAVICHHLQFAEYIENNIFPNFKASEIINTNDKINSSAIKSLNIKYIKKELSNYDDYNEISHGDFYDFALFLISIGLVNVNAEIKNTYGIIS